MTDLEVLLILIGWAFIIVCIYVFGETGVLKKFLEIFVNEINPNIEEVTRCEDCKYYNPKVGMCYLHWDSFDDEGFAFVVLPNDYCGFAEKRADNG